MGNSKCGNRLIFYQIIHSQFLIPDTLEAKNNAKNIEIFSVSNLSDNESFPGRLLRKSETVSSSQINAFFGWGGLLLNILGVKTDNVG